MLKRWGHEAKQDPDGEHEQHFVRNVFKRLPTDLRRTRAPSALDRSVLLPTKEGESAKVDGGPSVILPPAAESEAISTATALLPISASNSTSTTATSSTLNSPQTSPLLFTATPKAVKGDAMTPAPLTYRATCGFPTLFDSFPRSLVVCGDAERLVREVRSLIAAMNKDGVDLDVVWARDACHDILMLNEFWWDRAVIEEVWEGIATWAEGFKERESDAEDIPEANAGDDTKLKIDVELIDV